MGSAKRLQQHLTHRPVYWPLLWIFLLVGSCWTIVDTTLLLYLKSSIHFSSIHALTLVADASAINYSLHLLTGYIADRTISCRSLLLISIAMSIIGCLVICLPISLFLYIGLSVMLTGTGFMYSCIYLLIAQSCKEKHLYKKVVTKQVFVSNLSSLVFSIFFGWLQLNKCYRCIFFLTACIVTLALPILYKHWKRLSFQSLSYRKNCFLKRKKYQTMTMAVIIFLIPCLVFLLLKMMQITSNLMLGLSIAAICYLLIKLNTLISNERKKLLQFIGLWLLFLYVDTLLFLAPLSISLFYINNVHHEAMGFTITLGWFNSASILIYLSILVANIYIARNSQNNDKFIPLKHFLCFSLLAIGLSLYSLALGIHVSHPLHYIGLSWVLIYSIFLGISQFCSYPISFRLAKELGPSSMQGILIGLICFTNAIASILSSYISIFTIHSTSSTQPAITNPYYFQSFLTLGTSAIICALVVILCDFLFKRKSQQTLNNNLQYT